MNGNRRFYPLTTILFFLSIFANLQSPQECHADKLITFEGTFLYHDDIYPPHVDDTVTHRFSLEYDGIITVSVIFEPRQSLYPNNQRTVYTTIWHAEELCEDRKMLLSKTAESGEIYEVSPLAAGEYELYLNPKAYMQDGGVDSSYTVYINFTTSDPSANDKDTCVAYASDSICNESTYENWGILSLNSILYSHIGYTGCLTDFEDNFLFQVPETGDYYFIYSSNQTDITNCYEKAQFTFRFDKISGTPHSSFYVEKPYCYGNGSCYNTIGPISFSENTQYKLQISATGPDFDMTNCYAAFSLTLTNQPYNLRVTGIDHAETAVCGNNFELDVNVRNSNPIELQQSVDCYFICKPDITEKISRTLTLPANSSAKIGFSWHIPRIGPETGKCTIGCGVYPAVETSRMQLTCDRISHSAAYLNLLLDIISDDN